MKKRMVEKSEGWRGGGRDGEPLIIYDSLSFSKQPSGPAPCFPLTFNLSKNQRAWSLIIFSVCQRLCLTLPDTEVRSQAVWYTRYPGILLVKTVLVYRQKVSMCKVSLIRLELPEMKCPYTDLSYIVYIIKCIRQIYWQEKVQTLSKLTIYSLQAIGWKGERMIYSKVTFLVFLLCQNGFSVSVDGLATMQENQD